MIKKLNEGRVRDVITLRDLFSLTRANIRVTIVDTSIDEFVVEDDYIYNVVKDSPTILDFPVDHFSPRSSTSLWIEVSVGIGNIGGKLSAYKESKPRTRKRSIKEDIDDYEVIASFKSKTFCVGNFDDVEQDLLNLVQTNEQALRELISYLRDVGYSVDGDVDVDDYVDWFGTELYECIAVNQESELSFGHFNFKQKNLRNYY